MFYKSRHILSKLSFTLLTWLFFFNVFFFNTITHLGEKHRLHITVSFCSLLERLKTLVLCRAVIGK